MTMFLDSDLDFDRVEIDPITKFVGTFDGQGHAISNFKIGTSSLYCRTLWVR